MNKELFKNNIISVNDRYAYIADDRTENISDDTEVKIVYCDEPEKSYFVPYGSCMPIPLTLQSLKAFGFQKVEGDVFNREFNEDVYRHPADKENKLKIIDKGKEGIKLSVPCGENYPDKFISVTSLHDLQNLFRKNVHQEIKLAGN